MLGRTELYLQVEGTGYYAVRIEGIITKNIPTEDMDDPIVIFGPLLVSHQVENLDFVLAAYVSRSQMTADSLKKRGYAVDERNGGYKRTFLVSVSHSQEIARSQVERLRDRIGLIIPDEALAARSVDVVVLPQEEAVNRLEREIRQFAQIRKT